MSTKSLCDNHHHHHHHHRRRRRRHRHHRHHHRHHHRRHHLHIIEIINMTLKVKNLNNSDSKKVKILMCVKSLFTWTINVITDCSQFKVIMKDF